jgi:hypothetical protein
LAWAAVDRVIGDNRRTIMPKLHNVVLFGVLIVINGLLHHPPKPPLHPTPDLTALYTEEVPSLFNLHHPDWNRIGTRTAGKDWAGGLHDLRAQLDSHPLELRNHRLEVWKKIATDLPRWNSETFKLRMTLPAWTQPVSAADLRQELIRTATNDVANKPGLDTDWSGLLTRAAGKKRSAEWLRDVGPQWQSRPIGLPMASRPWTL